MLIRLTSKCGELHEMIDKENIRTVFSSVGCFISKLSSCARKMVLISLIPYCTNQVCVLCGTAGGEVEEHLGGRIWALTYSKRFSPQRSLEVSGL